MPRSSSRPSGTQVAPARLLPDERDGVDVAPVVALLAVGRAPVTEEPRRIRIGAMPEVLDAADAGGGEARGGVDDARKNRSLALSSALKRARNSGPTS